MDTESIEQSLNLLSAVVHECQEHNLGTGTECTVLGPGANELFG